MKLLLGFTPRIQQGFDGSAIALPQQIGGRILVLPASLS